jgi:Major capsid protein N-terminus/Large eukaryotic DNA virus major capsid protein
MSGGVVQLVAVGPQDAWLTGKPEVSFYRSNYKRYTHYSNSIERQVIQGAAIANGISTIRFEKKGDLLSYVYLTARDNNGAGIVGLDWSKVIDKVELYIGGQVVDTHDFEYMTDIEPIVGAQNFSQRYLNLNASGPTSQKNSFFPFKFFFCKEWSVALPLIGLQFHDVEIRITWSPYLNQTINIGPTTTPVLGAPNGTINTYSVIQGSGQFSNTANLSVSQNIGPLFPGMMLTSATTNLQGNVAVVQGFSANVLTSSSNISWSNILVSSSGSGTNSGIANVVALFNTAGGPLNAYAPIVSAQIPVAVPAGSATTTTATLTLTQVSSYTGGGSIAIGQYVAGLPFGGPVSVSNVNSATSVTVTFPSQTIGPLLAGTTISFFNGTASTTTTYSQVQYQAWSNFVYLDQSERDWFAKEKQDLLITQVQRIVMGTNPVQELALAQPVKFIAFPCVNYSQIFANGAGSATAANYQLKTQVNGVDIGDTRHLYHWVDVPQYYNTPWGYIHNNQTANIAIISYCLDTSKLQPTGTLNFSRLDNFRLVVPSTLPNGVLGLAGNINYPTQYLYAVNYNVFRIQNGLGSILYAN